MTQNANVLLLLLRTHTRERKNHSVRATNTFPPQKLSFLPFQEQKHCLYVPFSRRNETKLVCSKQRALFCQVCVLFVQCCKRFQQEKKKKGKKINIGVIKKRDPISSGRKKDDVLRILDGRGTRETAKGSRIARE